MNVHAFAPEQVQLFLEKVQILSFRKKDYLLAPPGVCRFVAIVLQGSFRMFRRTDDKEHTLHFFTENRWIGDFESFVVQQPTARHIQAMEKAEVAMIYLEDLHQMIAADNRFLAFFRVMKDWSVTTRHYTSLIDDNPDARYRFLLDTHPDWILRFPQMHLAAYLGMTRETFSRVKRRNLSHSLTTVTNSQAGR